MRDRMERLVVLPFSVGCVSQSSVAVGQQPPKRSKPESISSSTKNTSKGHREEEEEGSLSGESMKSSFRFLGLPKPNISNGFQRLFKSFKSFSQIFVFKDEIEEMDMEMEIGFPTDVKHVTHIGLDGSATTNPMKGWDNLISPELLSLPSVSLRQFELAMAAQADTSHVKNVRL
ncbi:CRIB domain [Dillenia turbinata]|uniref:CRIB domain n=1 Tax=Dillenia turbinata TaxID=194707 RepID=A0AAN8YWS2_9MAGN